MGALLHCLAQLEQQVTQFEPVRLVFIYLIPYDWFDWFLSTLYLMTGLTGFYLQYLIPYGWFDWFLSTVPYTLWLV